MDNDASDSGVVIYNAVRSALPPGISSHIAVDVARVVWRDLGANGYVVVPRHLLDELLAASGDFSTGRKQALRLLAARAAVVEAVGPTREDTK